MAAKLLGSDVRKVLGQEKLRIWLADSGMNQSKGSKGWAA